MNSWDTSAAADLFRWVLTTSGQASVLALLILLVQALFGKRLSPGWRYGLWLLLLARLLLPSAPQSGFSVFNLASFPSRAESPPPPVAPPPPFLTHQVVTFPFRPAPAAYRPSFPEPVNRGSDQGTLVTPAPRFQKPSVPQDPWQIAAWLWAIGMGVLVLRMIGTHVRFLQRLRSFRDSPDPEVQRVFEECREVMNIGQKVRLLETHEVLTPSVYGLWRKRLLLPEGMAAHLTRDELRHVFLHELAHLKRRDLEVNWLVEGLRLVHWFNPILWLAFRRLRADRELATDALALSRAGEGQNVSYGETILKVLEGFGPTKSVAGLVGIAEGKELVAVRMRAIGRYGRERHWGWLAAVAGLVLGGVALTDADTNPPQAPSLAGSTPEVLPSVDGQGPRRFEIRVMDEEAGAPVVGVATTFELQYESGAAVTNRTETTADGRASANYAPDGLKRFAYRLVKEGYLLPSGEWLPPDVAKLPEQFEVKLNDGLVMGGTVTGEDGSPIQGAEILLEGGFMSSSRMAEEPPSAYRWDVPAGLRLAVTDGTGEWRGRYPGVAPIMPPRVIQLPTGARTTPGKAYKLRVRHPDYADRVYSTIMDNWTERYCQPVTYEDLTGSQAKFSLVRGSKTEGRVLDEAGTPLVGATVRYSDLPSEAAFHESSRATQTDADGRFAVLRPPQLAIKLVVQRSGYAPWATLLPPDVPTPNLEVRLTKASKVLGRVTDPEDKPVSGARVSLSDNRWRGVQWEATTDADGRFAWEDAPRGTLNVVVATADFQPKSAAIEPDVEASIRLDRLPRLSGRVLDARTKQPLDSFQVFWAVSLPRRMEQQSLSRTPGRPLPPRMRGELYGEFTNGLYSIDTSALKTDSPFPGNRQLIAFQLRFEARGYRSKVTEPVFVQQFAAQADLAADVELEPDTPIRLLGSVVDAEGQPVAGAQVVSVAPEKVPVLAGRPAFENQDRLESGTTDQEGRFDLNADPETRGLVAVHETGVGWATAGAGSNHVTVRLQPWASVEGRAVQYDEPVANSLLQHHAIPFDLMPSPGTLSPSQPTLFLNRPTEGFGPDCNLKLTTDADGRFSCRYVPPGLHSFSRRPAPGSLTISGPSQQIRIEPGEQAVVSLGGSGRPVVGRFLAQDPRYTFDIRQPFQSVRTAPPTPPLSLKTQAERLAWHSRSALGGERQYPIQVNKDGTFRIEDLPPGKYEFMLRLEATRRSDMNTFFILCTYAFEVPSSDLSSSREPLDLGRIAGIKLPSFPISELSSSREPLDLGAIELNPKSPAR